MDLHSTMPIRPHFQQLLKYYASQSESAYQDTWTDIADSLLRDMSGDGEKFAERVSWSGIFLPDFSDDPVLSKIQPASFVDKLVSCNPTAQRKILESLQARYNFGRLNERLTAECVWIVEVYDELMRRLPALPVIRQYSLSRDTERLLGSALKEARQRLVGS